jgi:lipopolysaccharide transport system permease protein
MTQTQTPTGETLGATQQLSPHAVTIEPARGWTSLGLRELWTNRELLYFLVWREVQGAYRQTALGMSWIFLRPLLNVLILSLVFGAIVKVPSEGVPYPLFSMTALLPWSFFTGSVQRASRSLVDNTNVISKVYFPRMVIPIAATASGLVDFGAAFVVMLVTLLFYRMPLRPQILLTPLLLVVTFAFALAVGLWLATLSVKYRDVSFAIVFLLQALMYLSPVIYPVSMVPEPVQPIYALNPMTGVIQGFRWAILGIGEPPGALFLVSVVTVLILLIGGAFVFTRTEQTIVDVL